MQRKTYLISVYGGPSILPSALVDEFKKELMDDNLDRFLAQTKARFQAHHVESEEIQPSPSGGRIEVAKDFPGAAAFVEWLTTQNYDAAISTDNHSYVSNCDTSVEVDASNILMTLWKRYGSTGA